MVALRTGQAVRDMLMGIHRPDGTFAWLSANAEIIPAPETGKPTGVVTSFFDITARREAQKELQARAEQEALLNRINASIRATTDPETIQERAVMLVGEALRADRCYFSVYDPQRDAVRISRDWHRPDLRSVAGEYPLLEYKDYVDALYADGTAVIADALAPHIPPAVRRVLGSFGIRALLAVPLLHAGEFEAALAASMNDGPRSWTPDEIALMEAVLTQTRSAVEMARVTQREHAIATQLQEALHPPLPETVPGLALTQYYRPALAQSEGVGGDFFDVYALEKGCTALVVGDISGKGLAAAAQVSTVRNMLRAFLYSQPTVADAVTQLNCVLAENNLLSGFTTLFVSCYDSATGSFNYVNCGQEPALVRRAGTGAIEQLPPTGPILGAIEGAQYIEASVILASGEALAIFTDGLTEVGVSHMNMLGVEGIANLLSEPVTQDDTQSAEQMAEALMLHLIAGVDAFAESGARDDMCLLLGVVQ